MTCTRCQSTGFLNTHQLPDLMAHELDMGNLDQIKDWIKANPETDVQVCDCCGDGENWHGIAGEHYHAEDPQGPQGPYAYNGGLCECH